MMLNNPSAEERDNQNSLRKFPFSDAASCTNGAATILPGAVVDAQLYIPGRSPGRVWMSRIGDDGKLRFSDEDGEFSETAYPLVPESAIPVTFTGDGGPVPGGVVVTGGKASVAAMRSLGGQEFDASQTELAPAALAWPGLPGVLGFRLDDGNVVCGNVRIRGRNGCEVSTYEDSGSVGHIRFSAVGDLSSTSETTGFITKVVASSDNKHFTVSKNRSDHTVDILATGVAMAQGNNLSADQDNVCEAVRRTRGTVPSASATVPVGCGDDICDDDPVPSHSIYFMDGTTPVSSSPVTVFEGAMLGTLDDSHMPDPEDHPGMRLLGYFDSSMNMYYRYDGSGNGRFTGTGNVTLYAQWVSEKSEVQVTFNGYGTLHMAAPDAGVYDNPISISGVSEPVPSVKEIPDDTLVKGGAEALAEIVMHPTVPAGTVVIGIRGLDKAYST